MKKNQKLNQQKKCDEDKISEPDCKEIKIIEKKFEEDIELKNIEIIKMENNENNTIKTNSHKLKNLFDLDKIMTDFNNLFNDIEIKKPLELDNPIQEKNDTNKNNQNIKSNELNDVNNVNNENLIFMKSIIYQNTNYKIPVIRILPTYNLNFSNLYKTKILESNIIQNFDLSIELSKDNLSYLIKLGTYKYLINKINNNIVLTNLFNKDSQILKNKDNFKLGNFDFILYNDCTLLMQVINKTYFDNNYSRTFNVYIPKNL